MSDYQALTQSPPRELLEALYEEAVWAESRIGLADDPWSLHVCAGETRGSEPGGTHTITDPLYHAVLARHREDPVSAQGLSFWYHAASPKSLSRGLGKNSALDELAAHFETPEQRRALSSQFGLSLEGARVSLNLTRFGPGAFLSPHTDSIADGSYLLTLITFLNQNWHHYLGGRLVVQNGDEWKHFMPIIGGTVGFIPGPHTAHYVEMVHTASPIARFAVSGWYYRDASLLP